MPFPFDSYYTLVSNDIAHLLQLPSYPIATTVALVSLVLLFLVSVGVYYFRSTYHSISSIVVVQFLWVGLLVAFLSKEVIYIFAPHSHTFCVVYRKNTTMVAKGNCVVDTFISACYSALTPFYYQKLNLRHPLTLALI